MKRTPLIILICLLISSIACQPMQEKRFVQSVHEIFENQCKPNDLEGEEEVIITEKDIKRGHRDLKNFMSFLRKDDDSFYTSLGLSSVGIFSIWGYILLLFPFAMYSLAFVLLITVITFFCIPPIFSMFYSCFDSNYTVEEIPSDTLEGYEYYKIIKNRISRYVSLIHLFMCRFVLAVVLLIVMGYSIYQIHIFDDKQANCGMVEAANDLLNSDHNSEHFMTLMSGHDNIMSRLIQDLKEYNHDYTFQHKMEAEKVKE